MNYQLLKVGDEAGIITNCHLQLEFTDYDPQTFHVPIRQILA
jgi:hypothetical protein